MLLDNYINMEVPVDVYSETEDRKIMSVRRCVCVRARVRVCVCVCVRRWVGVGVSVIRKLNHYGDIVFENYLLFWFLEKQSKLQRIKTTNKNK